MKMSFFVIACGLMLGVASMCLFAVPINLNGWKVLPDSSRGEALKVGGKDVLRVHGGSDTDQRGYSPAMELKPGGTYQLKFLSQSDTTSGFLPCGVGEVFRDHHPTLQQTDNSFALQLPSKNDRNAVVLGTYNVPGYVDFSDVELVEVQVVHSVQGDLTLGDGETVQGDTYVDVHNLNWQGSTIHRTLKDFTAGFNSNRWLIGAGAEVIYNYDMPFSLTTGKVAINCNYHISGAVLVEVSSDGNAYTQIGKLSSVSSGEFEVPAELLPSKNLLVKISAEDSSTSLQINNYQFSAKIDRQVGDTSGRTLLITEPIKIAGIDAQWVPEGSALSITWTNNTAEEIAAQVVTKLDGAMGKAVNITIPANGKTTTDLAGSRKLGAHQQTILLVSGDNVLYTGSVDTVTTVLQNDDYGYRLASSVKGIDLWWCESDWKVSPNREAPVGTATKPVSLSAAKGEFEGVQVVLTPNEDGITLTGASISNLVNGNNQISSASVKFYEVATVRVNFPSDYLGEAGEYPDPIPPLTEPVSISKGRNQSVLVSVRVPEDAAGGVYKGNLTINTTKGNLSTPFELTVYDFAIPQHATLRSALGVYNGFIHDYFKPADRAQQVAIWDKWMKNFAEHRISPYSFYPYASIGFKIVGEPGNRRVELDWTEFDKAAEMYLDRYNLSSFQLPVNGLGGGTFYDRELGELDGHKAGTPEYEKLMADYLGQLESHLKEKGWLSKAYIYWFDEPDEKDYPFVIEVMERIKKYAPGLKRLLTEQPEPPLYGNVDIWCGLTNLWSKKTIDERNAAGEDVWWYICVVPKAPYVGEFIDHPGGEMRLWIWQTWQYHVKGILIWTTNWWTSSAAFPNSMQNPWEDAMSYVSGYGTPPGTKQHWGNGDGRFLYPPRRDPNTATEPYLGDPISSVRWEALRDGMEDYEYFIILQRLIEQKSSQMSAELKEEAAQLLVVPDSISKDLTSFTTDPRLILQHRDRIAKMIERLNKL